MTQETIAIVTVMKDEGPFILEWIAWNRMIGVNHFIVMTNDCSDGTDHILDRLDEMGIVTHLPNPIMLMDSGSVHVVALKYAQHLRQYRQADWIFHTDVDEFLNIQTGDGDLHSLIAASKGADAISICETLMGAAGIEEFEDAPVTGQFLYGMRKEARLGEERRGVKTIFRNNDLIWRGRKNHRPKARKPQVANIRWVDGSANEVPLDFVAGNDPGMDCNGRSEIARLHHYSIRSMGSFLAKLGRGDAVKTSRTKKWMYWRKRNQNTELNEAMLDHQPALIKAIDQLKADPILAQLHEKAVTHHRECIAAALADPGIEDLIAFYRRTIWGQPDHQK